MSRNIIEFGFGHYSSSRPEPGDKLLAAEPLVGLHARVEVHPDLEFFHLDEIAIMGYNGHCDIHYNLEDILHSTCDPACLPLRRFEEKVRVPCLTLDTWIDRYAHEGFRDRIDVLNVVLNHNSDDIFDGFSFNPKPEFIMLGHPNYPERTIERMKSIGYKIYHAGGKVVAIDIGR